MPQEKRRIVKAVLNLVTALAVFLFIVLVLPRLIGFFMPFVLGWIIALIANPLVHFFESRIRIRRKAGSAIVIIAVLAGVILLGYALISKLVTEGVGFLSELPDQWILVSGIMEQAGEKMTEFFWRFPVQLRDPLTNVKNNLSSYISNFINGMSVPTVTAVGNFAKNIPSMVVGTVMCLLSSYFFVAEKNTISVFLKKHTADSVWEKLQIMSDGLTGAVGGYFAAQMRIELVIYFILFVGLLILQVNYSFLIAFLIAVLDFLPVFGAGAILWPWALVALLAGDFKRALGLMIIWGVAQLIRQLIQPKFVADSIGLSPIPTLFLIYIGYKVGSVAGMILAVPLGIVVIRMYEAGFFDTTINSVRILLDTFNSFRRLTPEDLVRLSATGNREEDRKKKQEKGGS